MRSRSSGPKSDKADVSVEIARSAVRAAALDIGATGAPIVGTDAAVTREQGHDVIKAVTHMTTHPARRPARRRLLVVDIVQPSDERLHLMQQLDEWCDW